MKGRLLPGDFAGASSMCGREGHYHADLMMQVMIVGAEGGI